MLSDLFGHTNTKTYNTMTIIHSSLTVVAQIWANIDLELNVLHCFLDRDFTQNNYWLKYQDIEQSIKNTAITVNPMHLTRISQRHLSKPIWLVRKAWTGGGLRVAGRFVQPPSLVCSVLYTLCSRSLNILCTFSTLYFSNHGHRFVMHPVHLQQPQIGILCPLVHPDPPLLHI